MGFIMNDNRACIIDRLVNDVPRLLKEQVEEILLESGMRAYLRRD